VRMNLLGTKQSQVNNVGSIERDKEQEYGRDCSGRGIHGGKE
jgi:hypothetical protein